jgi:hypothetical protein
MSKSSTLSQQDFDLMCFTIEKTFAKAHRRATLHQVVDFVKSLDIQKLEPGSSKGGLAANLF